MSTLEPLAPGLYIVATPIGNRMDLSQRALSTLRDADRVLAEDTRHSRRLLDYYGIDRQLVSLHEHNENSRVEQIRRWVSDGASVALVSDAGTPLISDPGYPVVAQLRADGVAVRSVPGPSAVIAALSISGLPADHFQFGGFLATRRGERERQLKAAVTYPYTSVFYESPRRLLGTLEVLSGLVAERPIVLCRELTKRHETCLSGTADEVLARVESDSNQQRGELVLLIKGAGQPDPGTADSCPVNVARLMDRLAVHLPPKKAAGEVAALTGIGKNPLYREWLARQNA